MDHVTDRLPKLRMPVLLIGGDRDPSLGPMKVIHKKIRGSKLVVLSPASHFANRDQPEAWNRLVLDFLARVDARGTKRGLGAGAGAPSAAPRLSPPPPRPPRRPV